MGSEMRGYCLLPRRRASVHEKYLRLTTDAWRFARLGLTGELGISQRQETQLTAFDWCHVRRVSLNRRAAAGRVSALSW